MVDASCMKVVTDDINYMIHGIEPFLISLPYKKKLSKFEFLSNIDVK